MTELNSPTVPSIPAAVPSNAAANAEMVTFDTLKVVAKLDIPAGKRLCRIIHKGGKESVGALVPSLPDEDINKLAENSVIKAAIKDMIESVQDKIARKELAESTGNNVIPTGVFTNTQAIIDFLEAEQESKIRLSKETIEQWFDADIQPLLVAALKAKGIMQEKQLADTCMAFKNSFGLLAGKQVSMSMQIRGQLEKALALLADDYSSPVAELIATKLMAVEEKKIEIDAL